MFAQVNSEHCEHKILTPILSLMEINKTPFELIKETFENNPWALKKHTMITQRL